MDLDALPKQVDNGTAYVFCADVWYAVPKELRANLSDWRTLPTWLKSCGIDESLVRVWDKKTSSTKRLALRTPKKSVMIPLDELVAKIGGVLKPSGDSTPLDSTSPDASASPAARMVTKYRAPVAPCNLARINLGENEGFVFDNEVVPFDVYGERTREGIRFCEISVVNLLGGSPSTELKKFKENEHYVVLECEDKRTHKFFTMQGLLCKITWTGTDIGRAIREWVHDKIFHGMFADPTTRLKYAQEELRTVHELFDLAAVALSGEAIICLGPASGIEDRAMVSKLAPDELVYRHVKTMDLGGYLKKRLNGDRVVVFMPTTVAAAEKVDIKFHDMLRDKSLLLTGKHFTAPDEDGMRKTFIAIVLEQDAADPTLSMYRQVETDLKSAVKDMEHFKQMLLKEEAAHAHTREQSKQILLKEEAAHMRTLEHHAQILACKDELVDQLRKAMV
jgi:hypothetical protein